MSISLLQLLQGITHITPGGVVMLGIGVILLYLAIAKEYEPMLLLPIGAGAIFANLPLSPMIQSAFSRFVWIWRRGCSSPSF
jgi:oxaloacetate decarboxylase beta subunit